MKITHTFAALLAVFIICYSPSALAQGSLTPPGAPAPTMKTLDQIEPRIAISATNTPGDANSIYKITQPGSYYLTGNISGASGKHGIVIDSDDVSLDLMGFTVQGVAGSLDGIRSTATWHNHFHISNGFVNGFGGAGATFYVNGAEQDISFDHMSASSNGTYGLRAGSNVRFSHCSAWANGSTGISAISNAVIDHCLVRQNVAGINVGLASSVTDTSVYNNSGLGISTSSASVVRGCAVYSNDAGGIQTSTSLVTDCLVYSNTDFGISAGARCLIRNNRCDSNSNATSDAAGILCTGVDSRIEGNACAGNSRGIRVTSTGCIIIRNTCSGSTGVNWDIAISNAVAPIVAATTNAAAISGNTYTGNLGSTDPNANFTY
jgi:parallel beta-helix repeat protein